MSTDSAYAVELKGLTFKRGSRAISTTSMCVSRAER